MAERILDQPLRALDPAVRRLIVIPDGPLYRLPVDALPLPDRTPLLTRYEVTIAPSVRLAGEWLRRPVESGRPAAPIVAFGDPRVDRRLGLRRLPGAAAEARLAARFHPDGSTHLGADATEAAFRQLDDRPAAIIHFATHARTETTGMLTSAIFLTPDGSDDGRLGPADIAGRRLRTDLVVLTGCGTSGGALTFGEGIQGLVAPFLEA
ncbi:MAG: CHAT domain-containing protein, partial [Gemmatimonadales bacterium]|nr:CHAT domain-containing protein [Gemmatimonadales bacterium]